MQSNRPALANEMQVSREHVDVFINFGFTGTGRDAPYNASAVMQTGSPGMSYFPMNHATTSWIAPIALPWAIMIKNTDFPDHIMDDEMITQIKACMTPAGCDYHVEDNGDCKVQDPAWYKQHELGRLKYLQ